MSSQSTHRTNLAGSAGDPYKWHAYGLLVLVVVTLPVIVGIAAYAIPDPAESTRVTSVALLASEPVVLSPGETVYQNTCKVCHGPNADGVSGLGKPLRNSAYVQESDDAELFRNIAEGRFPDDPLNTTGIMMPARGAQNITDEQITDVMVFLRSIQDTSKPTVSIEPWIVERAAPPEGDVEIVGRELFISSCSACHGPNGEGMEGIGKPFTTSEFVKNSTDKEIMMLIKMGRPVWDAANTTGVDMPPKGGNPAISDDELNDIITYIRSISTID